MISKNHPVVTGQGPGSNKSGSEFLFNLCVVRVREESGRGYELRCGTYGPNDLDSGKC